MKIKIGTYDFPIVLGNVEYEEHNFEIKIYDIYFSENKIMITSFDYEDLRDIDILYEEVDNLSFLFADIDKLLTEKLSELFDHIIISHGLNKVTSKWEFYIE